MYLNLSIIISTVFIVLISIAINVVLFYTYRKYYVKSRLAVIFPTHDRFYQKENAMLPNDKRQKRVVLFGDSRIQGWKNLPQIDCFMWINRGIGGETTAQIRARFEPDVLALQPNIVILQAGINDLLVMGIAPHFEQAIVRQCEDNLKFFVETLTKQSIEVVLLSIIPPAPVKRRWIRSPQWHKHQLQRVEQINQYWLNLPSTKHLHIIDTIKVFHYEEKQWHEGLYRDLLHLTPKGYQYLNQALTEVLLQLQ